MKPLVLEGPLADRPGPVEGLAVNGSTSQCLQRENRHTSLLEELVGAAKLEPETLDADFLVVVE